MKRLQYVGSVVAVSMQSVPFTTKNVSYNPVHGEVYFKQHFVIKVCQ